MPNHEITSDIDDLWDAPDENAAESVESSAHFVPASYSRREREVLALHTGSKETFLTVEQEQNLATLIQDGLKAQAEKTELEPQMERLRPARALREKYAAIVERINAGKAAEQVLIECNLRLSSHLARVSMNILPPGDKKAKNKDTKAGRRYRATFNDDLAWLPKDLTSLKSRYAVLDDRIQTANEALIKAVRRFTPGIKNKKGGNLVSFASFAGTYIKTGLVKYVKGAPDGHEKLMYMPREVVDSINRAQQNDWQEEFTPEEREKLLGYNELHDTIPLHELYFIGMTDEEIERSDDDPPLLWAGEVIPPEDGNDPVDELLDGYRWDLIQKMLETLKEREAGIIRLRFGLVDDYPHTLDEIGRVYGVTRERIRQVESRAMTKLSHPSRSHLLVDFKSIETTGTLPMRAGDDIKTTRSLGRSSLQIVTVGAVTEPEVERQSWQAYPGEPWDEPVINTRQFEVQRAATAAKLHKMIFEASLYTFQKSFVKDISSPYPKLLVDRITETFGPELTVGHVADFWNNHLEAFLAYLDTTLGDDACYDRATQLLSRLLAERMTDNDAIELQIPPNLNGKLGYVGAWLPHGTVRVLGDVGDSAGYEMSSLGHLQIKGAVQHFAGERMAGHARLEIDGNAGDFLGSDMRGAASILVNGNVGAFCGHRIKTANAIIEVLGRAGHDAGYDARGGQVIVNGKTVVSKK